MTDSEKFKLEMVSLEELCELARCAAQREAQYKETLRHKTHYDADYIALLDARNSNKRRLKYLQSRIKSRQMPMPMFQ